MDHAGLIFDHSIHYIDHLAPFCALANWPLIVCEEQIAQLVRQYYPGVEVIESSIWDVKLPTYTLSCDNGPLLKAAFPNQNTKLIWLPHGNSDKGWNGPFFDALSSEDIALVYGQKMIDFMQRKNVFPKTIPIGNFRWHYYCKHRSFYEQHSLLPKKGQNFLYAPTWDDSEGNCSFWKAFPRLVETVPGNLIVKLHPNTLLKFDVEIEVLKGRFEKKNVFFLSDYPPIYPLLIHCDAYIGDMSSIGYDFLKFDKPMYFLNASPVFPLHQCGQSLETYEFLPQKHLASIRKKTYDATFASDIDWTELTSTL